MQNIIGQKTSSTLAQQLCQPLTNPNGPFAICFCALNPNDAFNQCVYDYCFQVSMFQNNFLLLTYTRTSLKP